MIENDAPPPHTAFRSNDAALPVRQALGQHGLILIEQRGILANPAGNAKRACDIQFARALLEVIEARQRLRRVHQDRFDKIGSEVRIRLQEQRGGTGHNGRRHGTAAEAHQLV